VSTRKRGRLFAAALVAATAGCAQPYGAPGIARRAIVADSPVVISQVYGGGGNASAPYQNDFVELFNRSTNPVSLAGWSVQYTSATGTGSFSGSVTMLAGSLGPGQYYLVRMAAGAGTGVPLPPPDATGGASMSATAGKVALVASAGGLACNGSSTPCSPADDALIQDLVGYGGANFSETAPTGTLSNTTAALRNGAGCTDTNNNSADFAVGAPAPRNTASPVHACGGPDAAPSVLMTSPGTGATNVSPATTVSITFSEPVTVDAGWFTFTCASGGPVTAAVSGGPTAYLLTPSAPLLPGDACQVTIVAGAVHDVDASDPPDVMAADVVVPFTIAAPVVGAAIHAIQGAAHLSPLAGQVLDAGPAIVTALASNGFYMQDPNPDADDATSEGIFVFTSVAPTVLVGDSVVVRGTVSEFRPGCSGSCTPSSDGYVNLTSTELVSPVVTVSSHGNPLPPPVVLGSGPGARTPPGTVIEDDASGDVETAGVFDPATDGIDFFESLEGMRILIDHPQVVGPSKVFSGTSVEIAVVGADAAPRTGRGGIIVGPTDFNPERMILNNGIVPTLPLLNVGDRFDGSVVGVVGYSFSNFKILVSDPPPPVVSGGLAPEVTALAPASPTQLTVASLNVENLDPTDPPAKFSRLAAIAVDNLKAPDLLALEEIQDNNGATDNGVVAADVTLNQFVAAIAAAGGPAYSYRQIDPQNDQDGGEPGGNIRVALLYRTDRGLAFVDRPGAGATTANQVTGGAGAPHLAFSPGRLDPTNAAFSSSRKPLAAELTFAGQTLFVIANHFNSKGGDQPLYGRFQPPTLGSETQRLAQANVVAGFVSQLTALDPNAKVIVLGDLNDFQFSNPLGALKAAGLTALIETLPASERYSYVYDGNSQALDHILVTNGLKTRATFDVVHVNAEYADQASDHDPGIVRLELSTASTAVPALPPALLGLLALAFGAAGIFGRRPRH
jgi:predicted extracellular nuclease